MVQMMGKGTKRATDQKLLKAIPKESQLQGELRLTLRLTLKATLKVVKEKMKRLQAGQVQELEEPLSTLDVSSLSCLSGGLVPLECDRSSICAKCKLIIRKYN